MSASNSPYGKMQDCPRCQRWVCEDCGKVTWSGKVKDPPFCPTCRSSKGHFEPQKHTPAKMAACAQQARQEAARAAREAKRRPVGTGGRAVPRNG